MTAFASRHFEEPAVLVREAVGDYNQAGKFVPGDDAETPLSVVTWPPTTKDAALFRDVLPGGARISEMRWFCMETPVVPLGVGSEARNADKIRYGGLLYTVRSVQPWEPHGFVAALATRDEGQDG